MNTNINAWGTHVETFLQPLLGNLGAQLPNVLVTLLILIVGIFIAKMVRKGLKAIISKSSIGEKLNETNEKATEGIASLGYYIVLLNVLLIVLERMNITSVLDPLKQLASQFMSALPNIIGAAIIFYAGWIIAKLASSFVSLAAGKLDQQLEAKNFNPDFKASKFLGAFVFGGVLLPIVVAGFEFLNIKPISEPATQMITEFMNAVPNIIAAALILVVAYVLGKFIIFMLSGLLEGMNVDQLPAKVGLQSVMGEQRSLVSLIGSVMMFFIMLTATTAAIDKLDIALISDIFAKLITFGGGILLGGVILTVGYILSNIAHEKLALTNSNMANIARFAILGLVLAMGLRAMGLADNIVNMAFAFTFGAIAVASALAFGLGGKEAAKTLTTKWAEKVK
ncbi:MAG: mechanosensitive ion channel [Cellvibrionaceae bacterium]